MMVNGSHREDAFSPQLEAAYLKDDGESFCHEHSTDDDKEKFLPDTDRGGSQRTTDGK